MYAEVDKRLIKTKYIGGFIIGLLLLLFLNVENAINLAYESNKFTCKNTINIAK